MRLYRDIAGLWSRARRPAVRLLIGGGLIVPAAVLTAGRDACGPESVSVAEVLSAEARADGGYSSSASAVQIAAGKWTEEEVAPPVGAREEAPDWSEGLDGAAGTGSSVALLAQEFEIALPLAAQIHEAALAANIKPRTAFGLVQAESSFRTRAVSPVGAVGLTQLLPSTARWLVPGTTRRDLMRPETNLRVGFKYLRQLIDQFNGDEQLALTAYNRGPGTVSRLLKRGRDPDNGYADKVLTGSSAKHVRLMNAKFGSRRSR